MPKRKVVITLDERHIQAIEQAVIAADAGEMGRFPAFLFSRRCGG